jgi:TolB-like protein/Tfp pilus assembly protein PilF
LPDEERRLVAIMFTDMVGYTAITQSDEALALGLLETQSGILLPLIRAHRGLPVKTIGDAHLAEFGSALDAVKCAVEIQKSVREHNASAASGQAFRLRIGIHIGDVVHRDKDVFGDAVNIASRLEPIADPGGVCVSQQVYDQVHNKTDFQFEKLPLRQLKNVSDTIEVYRVKESIKSSQSDEEPRMPKDRVAVLPLANFSPSSQDEYLADGMTEELITAISGVQGLKVIARTSVMRFKGTQTNISEIGKALNAGTILEGSFRKIGDRIRVTVQLIDAMTEEHRWASNYDGDMHDIFSIQADIANRVAEALRGRLVTGAVPRKEVDIQAYENYLRGRQFWSRRDSEGVMQALKLFQAAVARDPSFAKAYTGIADCYLIGEGLNLFSGKDVNALAEEAIRKALELEDLPEAHASLGLLLNNKLRYSEAQEEFRRAVSLNPNYASAHHWYAICLANIGKLDQAVEEARLASQADPLSPPSRNILGVMHENAKDFNRALEVYTDVLKLDPSFRPAWSFRSGIYMNWGMEAEAKADLERWFQSGDEFDRESFSAYLDAWFGRLEEARKHMEAAEKLAPSERGLRVVQAIFAACVPDPNSFFNLIGQTLEFGDIDAGSIRYAWWLDRVRGDPRFADLIRSLPT